MTSPEAPCAHQDQIKTVTPSGDDCEQCLADGTKAVALRMCLTCGHVGCCDSSVGRHARKHFESTGHPIMESYKSASPNAQEWRFCYVDNAYL